VPAGLTLAFNEVNSAQQARLLSFIDSIFSVAIVEKQSEEVLTLTNHNTKENFRYVARPYEQFCKENLSWLEKHLKAIKLHEGIPFSLKDLTSSPKHNELMQKA
jgi:hypothetical protein